MNKVMTAALAALALAAVALGVQPRLWEDFERVNFPPRGWYTEGNETVWSRGASTYDYYARGNLTVETGSSWASLVTRDFPLKTSAEINLRLHYIAGYTGDGSGKSTVALRRGTTEVWSKDLKAPVAWTRLNTTLGPYKRADNYNLRFTVTGTASRSLLTAWLYVDNIHVRECATAVAPTSLGRVKALYR
jgi:hypothetical protein